MKRTLLSASAILLVLSSSPSIAAESGFYAGATLGYSDTGYDYTETTAGVLTDSGSVDLKGADFGVLGGYRYHFANKFFLGAEGEFTLSAADGTFAGVLEFEKKHAFGLYVKPGYQFTDQFAVFGTLGWKWTEYEVSLLGISEDETLDGFVFGGGVEYAFTPKISLAAEYNRVNIDSDTLVTGAVVEKDKYDENIFKVALKYHF